MIWYEEEVKRVEAEKAKLGYEPKTVFYGSSSIRLWTRLYEDFKPFEPVNLGFGGSTLAACVWFFERILCPYQPERIVFYAGDNDLGDGRHPEEVAIFFAQLTAQLHQWFPDVHFYFISIKPSLARWDLINNIRYANQLVKAAIDKAGPSFHYINIGDSMLNDAGKPQADLFEQDGLHLSDKGYGIWNKIVQDYLQSHP